MSKHRSVRRAIVRTHSQQSSRGWVGVGALRLGCALGRNGCRHGKREGDGATPIGRWRLEQVYYRPDRLARPRTTLPVAILRPDFGWCDGVHDRNYNRLVRLPYAASHEVLWRDDHLYDIVVVLSHNRRPRVQAGGSAIFMHLAHPDFTPTAGCIALQLPAMRRLLAASPAVIDVVGC